MRVSIFIEKTFTDFVKAVTIAELSIVSIFRMAVLFKSEAHVIGDTMCFDKDNDGSASFCGNISRCVSWVSRNASR